MKRLIINADDLGFSEVVNESIVEGAEKGLITAASLMVNMPFAEKAAELVRERTPHLSIGLHFCLTSGIPLSNPNDIPLLVDSSGRFRHGFFSLFRLLRSRNSQNQQNIVRQVQIEWLSQLAEMNRLSKQYGLRFDHIDSHQHVHVLPRLWGILAEESEKRQITLRVPREPFLGWGRLIRRFSVWGPIGLLKRTILNTALYDVPQKIGYFGILDTGKMDANAITAIALALSRDQSALETYELNTHPAKSPIHSQTDGCRCSDDDFRFHTSTQRQMEHLALLSDDVRAILEKNGIQLVGFP
ncbi:MAG: carbohydrate deacetylase [Thermoguttaceae bacterium]